MPARKRARKVQLSRVLVIDASIVRSAGSIEAVVPVSVHCRDTLRTVLDVCHKVLLSDDVKDEWTRHMSKYARTWLTAMYARRKVVRMFIVVGPWFDRLIKAGAFSSEPHRAAVAKDRHMIDGAIATGKVVLSLGDTIWRIFQGIKKSAPVLNDLIWANPSQDFDRVKAWLEETASADAAWHLTPRPAARRRKA